MDPNTVLALLWITRFFFLVWAAIAYLYQRKLEKQRDEITLFDAAPDFLQASHPEWGEQQKVRQKKADRMRNWRDACAAIAILSLLASFWL